VRKLLVSLHALAVIGALLPAHALSQTSRVTNGSPKYVFLFLVDGGGATHLEIARQYRQYIDNEGMVIVDKIMKEGSVGVMTTHAANSLSTDSAAAATAMASGCKAKIGAL
jgi:alkaline phosphatase